MSQERYIHVGRSYTRSRRFPGMFGKMPGDGGHVWGGPYTSTQGIVFLLGLLLVWAVPIFWVFGPVRWLLPAIVAFFIKQAKIESRSPLAWLWGLLKHLSTKPHGSVAGSAYAPAKPHRVRTRFYLHSPTEALPDPVPESLPAKTEPQQIPAAPPVPPARPAPPQKPRRALEPAVALSPLQQLLSMTESEKEKVA